MTEVVLLLAVLGGATAFGVWRRQTDGRMRVVAHEEIADGMGDRDAGRLTRTAGAGPEMAARSRRTARHSGR